MIASSAAAAAAVRTESGAQMDGKEAAATNCKATAPAVLN